MCCKIDIKKMNIKILKTLLLNNKTVSYLNLYRCILYVSVRVTSIMYRYIFSYNGNKKILPSKKKKLQFFFLVYYRKHVLLKIL